MATIVKPSKAMLCPGAAIQYWWAYSTSVPTSSSLGSSTRQPRRSLGTKSNASKRQHTLGLETQYTHQCPYNHSRLRSSNQRQAHTRDHPPRPSPDSAPETYWPTLSPHKQPTPYDILSHPPKGPYNKRRFNYLVKLYHPDSNPGKTEPISPHAATASTHPSHLPTSIRIQRYHLLIQAHTLLSDPAKRAAYDRLGAGWASTPPLSELRRENSARGWAAAREFGQDLPYHCATWEDWEKWWALQEERRRQEDEGIFANDTTRTSAPHDAAEHTPWWVSWVYPPNSYHRNHYNNYYYNHQHHHNSNSKSSSHSHSNSNSKFWFSSHTHPTNSGSSSSSTTYISNSLFLILLLASTVTGAMWTLSRAQRSGRIYIAQLEKTNEESVQHLRRSRSDSQRYDSPGQSIGRFLRVRSEDRVFGGAIAEREGVEGGLEGGEAEGEGEGEGGGGD